MKQRNGDYSKPITAPAKLGETIQLIERAVAPIRGAVKLAVVTSAVALLVACAALVLAVQR